MTVLMAYMHQPIGRGRNKRNPKIQPGLKNHSALIHNARRRLPDCHPQHICGHTQFITHTTYGLCCTCCLPW